MLNVNNTYIYLELTLNSHTDYQVLFRKKLVNLLANIIGSEISSGMSRMYEFKLF